MMLPLLIIYIGFIISIATALALQKDKTEVICEEGEKLGYSREYVEIACKVYKLRLYSLIRQMNRYDP